MARLSVWLLAMMLLASGSLASDGISMSPVSGSTVHTGAGYKARLICEVHGQPKPNVSWSRSGVFGNSPLDKVRHRLEQDGAMYSLTIDEVRDSDLGKYTCNADDDSGGGSGLGFELTGLPGMTITSPRQGQETDSYTLRWRVESYTPVEEYKVKYRMAPMYGSSPKWEQITLPVPPNDGSTVMYSHMYVFRNLTPDTAYEALVTAKNKYGWSREWQEPFKLYTLESPRVWTYRDDSSSVRSGALAAMTASGTLAAVTALGALLAVF